MRTTLDIDDDVLQAAKELAQRHKKTTGEMLSALARKGLACPEPDSASSSNPSFLGFKPFPHRGAVVTNELINKIRVAEGGE
jgi:hypothetical protein